MFEFADFYIFILHVLSCVLVHCQCPASSFWWYRAWPYRFKMRPFAKMRPFIDQSLGHVEKLASAHTVRWMPAKLWDFFLSWESGSGIIWFGSGYGFSQNERSDKLLQFSFFPCFNCTDQFSLDCSFKLKVTPVGWFFFWSTIRYFYNFPICLKYRGRIRIRIWIRNF